MAGHGRRSAHRGNGNSMSLKIALVGCGGAKCSRGVFHCARCEAADPEGGAARDTGRFGVPGPQRPQFREQLLLPKLRLRCRRRKGGCWKRAGPDSSVIRSRRVMWIVPQHRGRRLIEKRKCRTQNVHLERWIAGRAERPAKFEGHPECPRGPDGLSVLADQAD